MHDVEHPATSRLATPDETRVACLLTLALLIALTLVKPLGGIPYLGSLAFTAVAFFQLYAPLWRADRRQLPASSVGLTLGAWRRDARYWLGLSALVLPVYALMHHLYMTSAHDWLLRQVGPAAASFVPRGVLAPRWPHDWQSLWNDARWLVERVATHVLGVALPEETFYRGYLQPCLEARWPPRRAFFGVRLGAAATLTAALFALGHFLGEWNPLRFGPFFPALLFAWLRNATGTVVAPVAFHATCNVASEVLFTLYVLA